MSDRAPARGNGWEHTAVPLQALLSALSAEDAGLRAQAAVSLGVRGDRRATPALLEALPANREAPRVRKAVYQALGRLGDDDALRRVPAAPGAWDARAKPIAPAVVCSTAPDGPC